MRYHIPLKSSDGLVKLEKNKLDAQALKCPRQDLWMLGQRLGANFYVPDSESVSFQDKIGGKITGNAQFWRFARILSSQLGEDDFLFCGGEDLGIPVATLCGATPNPCKIAVHFHNIDRPRGRAALKLFKSADQIDLFITHSRAQFNFLRNYLNLPESKIRYFWYSTDCNFFIPGLPSVDKKRTTIASVGLEMRDYHTLAAATENLDVDVKVAGFSQFVPGLIRSFPQTLPANMSNQFYALPELLQLYHDADIVAVCLHQSNCSAGATTLVEAMACKKTIVATRTQGLAEYFSDSDAIMTVEPGDSVGLKQAIVHLLKNPQEAQQRAERVYQLALERHKIEQHIDTFVEWFT